MSLASDNVNLVADYTDEVIDNFLSDIEIREKGLFNKLLGITKGLVIEPDGSIKRTTENLRLLSKIRQVIEANILTDAYKNQVDDFANQFPAVKSLNDEYFSVITESFKPNRQLYRELMQNSVKATKNSLLGSGVDEQLIQPIMDIVSNSVTDGASYADMVSELELKIKGSPETMGAMRRYSQQITTDALNQFNSAYNETIANDLDMDWFLYLGGRTSKTRPFCKKYHNQYFSRKEVEDFGAGRDLDGSKLCTKGFCAGRIKATNKSNIFRYRGGYNCKHVYKPTVLELVPNKVLQRNVDKGYLEPEFLDQPLIVEKVKAPKRESSNVEDQAFDQINKWYTDVRKAKYHESIKSYTGSGYRSINEALRDHRISSLYPDETKLLSKAIKDAPKSTGELWRGAPLDGDRFKEYMDKYVNGNDDTYKDLGFFSASWSKDTAKSFKGSSERSVMFRIHKNKSRSGAYLGETRSGSHGHKGSGHRGEREVIFDRGTKWNIIRADFKEGRGIEMDIEEI